MSLKMVQQAARTWIGLAITIAILMDWAPVAQGADWPMWRCDANRGNWSTQQLPDKLSISWTRELPAPMPAWPTSQNKVQFDFVAEPVVGGQRIFVPSSRHDSVSAYDTRSGKKLWTHFAAGPVRFSPVYVDGRVLYVADDGHLYCVSAEDGRELWKVNGGPRTRRILGNHRVVSSWPARGGPVAKDGRVYFAASIWSFMGIFVHCVDIESGNIVWSNTGDGTNFTVQPHGAPAFAAVVPQGHLAISGNSLIVPGGRSVPAVFDLQDGRIKHFRYDKKKGGHEVAATTSEYYTASTTYRTDDGIRIEEKMPLLCSDDQVIQWDGKTLRIESAPARIIQETKKDRRGKEVKSSRLERKLVASVSLSDDQLVKIHLRAGDELIGTDKSGKLLRVSLKDGSVRELGKVGGRPARILVADSRVFVIDDASTLSCFALDGTTQSPQHFAAPSVAGAENTQWSSATEQILDSLTLEHAGGYCLVLGLVDGGLVEELLRQSKLNVVAVDDDLTRVSALRQRLIELGLHGERSAVIHDDPTTASLPPYIASLIVSERKSPLDLADQLKTCLRPYGGQAVLAPNVVTESLGELGEQFRLVRKDSWRAVERPGAIPQTADWTHQYANPGQTGISSDRVVKTPLGVLWFGGPSHDNVLPRHGHGPSPQVAGGRLVIEGADMLRAVDVYTGRVLWEASFPKLGEYYNTTRHFPGANEIGSNYVTMPDAVYVVHGQRLVELDATDGKARKTFELSDELIAGGEKPNWGYLAATDRLLITTSSPVNVEGKATEEKKVPGTSLVARHANWQYRASDPANKNWNADTTQSDGWKTAAAGFGYGDDDDRTTVHMQGKSSRLYARTHFDLKDANVAKKIVLRINYDDAFIAYINGKEVVRRGVLLGRGAAAKGIKSHEAGKFEEIKLNIDAGVLRSGKNTLAIEGHNTSLTSSDFTLDPELILSQPNANATADKKPVGRAYQPTQYASGSKRLVVFARDSGELLWSRDAVYNFRHNNIAIGNGMVFCVDSLTKKKREQLQRRGVSLDEFQPTLYALDARTGAVVWQTTKDIYGTFLSYSAERDTLIQGGSKSRDRASDEIGLGLSAYEGRTGKRLWYNKSISYSGPCLMWRDKLLTNGTGGYAIDINTGEKTGWTYNRHYGCNTAIGSENLLTFRSGAAGVCDLQNDGGTGNLGGFRSSCTSNLIVANGVLNAPDYTRTCTCAYQNQTSLALIHMPEAEFWTFGAKPNDGDWAVNFGAPGDRRDGEGVLWTDYPSVGGLSHGLEIKSSNSQASVKRQHISGVSPGKLAFVAASALVDPGELTVKVPESAQGKTARITIILSEPTDSVRSFELVVGESVVADNVQIGGDKPFAEVNCSTELGKELKLKFNGAGDTRPSISGLRIKVE